MPTDPAIDLTPLDSEGLQANKPSYARKWSTLTNVIFKEGRLRPRPGFREFSDVRDWYLPSVERGVPLAIIEIHNPDDTVARDALSYDLETIHPDSGTTVVAGWTGTYTEIDETIPNGTDVMSTATDGAQISIGFGNLSNSPEYIPGFVVLARMRASVMAHRAAVNFYWRISSTNYLVYSTEISGSLSTETNDWDTIAFEVTRNPATGALISVSDINSLAIVVEYDGGSSYVTEFVSPVADGNYTQWKDWADWKTGTTSTAAFGDFDGLPPWLPGNDSNHGIIPVLPGTTANAKQSFTITASFNSTFDAVTSIAFLVCGRIFGYATLRLFYRTGGTDYTLGDFTVSNEIGPVNIFETLEVYDTNPATSAAWTQAELEGGEFGIQYVTPDNQAGAVVVNFLAGIVYGTTTGATVYVDWMEAQVMEATGSGNSAVLARDQIWVTDKAMLRYGKTAVTIGDVTNSVALTSPPNSPVDWAILYGQVYVTNGEDATRVYPNSSGVFTSLTANNSDGATALTGRTVAAFADRILYGWVKDNASYYPERVSYSKIFDGSTHNDASAGDFDLLGPQGGVVRLLPLSDSVCVAYKEQGIFNLRRTGSDVAPIAPDLMDAFTSCLAPRTVVATLTPAGTPVHLFLGTSQTSGLNVYAYDGSRVAAIGDGIQRLLQDGVNYDNIHNAFAIADPTEGYYYLFVPEGTEVFPDAGYIYNVRGGQWTRFTLPFRVNCAGVWSFPAPPSGQNYPNLPVMDAPRRVIVGLLGGRLVAIDFSKAHDSLFPATREAANPNLYGAGTDTVNGDVGEDVSNFTCTIETGDPRPDAHPGQQVTAYDLNLMYNAHMPVYIAVDSSTDGGVTYTASTTEDHSTTTTIGDLYDSDAYQHARLSVGSYARRPRVKLTIVPPDTTISQDMMFEFSEMWLENQTQGDKP